MKAIEKSNLSKINEIIFSKDLDFERLIKKSSSIFCRKIESIIEFKNNYFELLNKQEAKNKRLDESEMLCFDLTAFIKSRLKPVFVVFSLNSMLLEVYENDFYCKIINQSLNNKSIMITSIDLKTIINNEEFEKLVRLSEEEGSEELLYKIFKDYFENQFSEIVTDKMIYLSKIIYSFPTDKSFIYELNHLLVQNEIPLSILNNYELKNYIKSSITEGITKTIF